MMSDSRKNGYALLSAPLRAAPTADFMASLAALPTPTPTPMEADECARALAVLCRAAAVAEETAVAEDYQELLIGLGRGKIVPYGSWYLVGRMMDEPLARLRGDMKNLGIAKQSDFHEPEDHIAALCELMAMLCADQGADSFARQKKVFDAHLSAWAGTLFDDVAAQAESDFYRALGGFGRAFIDFEKRYFAMLF